MFRFSVSSSGADQFTYWRRRFSTRAGGSSCLPSKRETRKAEAVHVLAFLASLVPFTYALYNGPLDSAGCVLAFNLLLNVYPVMLQRYNRVRLEKLIQTRPPNRFSV